MMMVSGFAVAILNQKSATTESFDGHEMAFSYADKLGNTRRCKAAFLRVAADLIERDIDFDPEPYMDYEVVSWSNDNDAVVSFVVVSGGALDVTVEFAWTDPTYTGMGLFTSLMKTIISTAFSRKMAPRLRASPPISHPSFDSVLARLGFKPVSLVTEYRPY